MISHRGQKETRASLIALSAVLIPEVVLKKKKEIRILDSRRSEMFVFCRTPGQRLGDLLVYWD